MIRISLILVLGFILSSCGIFKGGSIEVVEPVIRMATYNTSLYQRKEGALIEKLGNDTNQQAILLSRIIRKIRPDILLLQEFDYDREGKALQLFQDNFLSNLSQGNDTIHYAYSMVFPSNTGIISPLDINGDGKLTAPADAYGFGYFEGQYGFAVLSRYPLDTSSMRTFQQFLWSAMPNPKIPVDTMGEPYYPGKIWNDLRLSSKNHVDLPVLLPGGKTLHLLLSHPTPPVFDGPEDRNGCRNYDEIRLWKDYIGGADYLVDDKGKRGGLSPGAHFAIMGDLNADPFDGDSRDKAILQLIDDERVHQAAAKGTFVPSSKGGLVQNRRKNDKGDPSHDTSFFGLRVDYILPDAGVAIKGSGIFWPVDGGSDIIPKKGEPSDHLPVWVDIVLP